MSMLTIMPDQPSTHEAYQLLPWWTLLHYVSKATLVLLLELVLDSQHFPSEVPEVVNYLCKAIGYNWCMTEGSLSAYRAWRISRPLLTDVSRRYDDLNIAGIPETATQPPGWTENNESAMRNAFS